MATEYTYSNIAEFNHDIFEKEIAGKAYKDDLLYVSHDPGTQDLVIGFSEALSAANESDLGDVINTHPSLKIQLDEKLANYRWLKETGGILSNGYGVDTSDRSKVLINGAHNKVKEDNTPAATMSFKTATGWHDLTHSEVESIALDVADHVRKCFEAENSVSADIWAGNITDEATVYSTFDSEYAAA